MVTVNYNTACYCGQYAKWETQYNVPSNCRVRKSTYYEIQYILRIVMFLLQTRAEDETNTIEFI